MSRHISDEQLHAFIDDQLGPEEQEQVFAALKADEQLNRRACEFHRLQDMLRHAYAELPEPGAPARPRRQLRLTRGIAAALLLVCGGLFGWLAATLSQPASPPAPLHASRPAQATPPPAAYEHQDLDAFQTVQLLSAQGTQQNVVIHVTTDDPNRLSYALSEIDDLLNSYQARGMSINLEVVANGDGMALLRSDTSPYPQRTRELIHKYDNLAVLACANTLRWLQDQGIDTHLLPDVGMTKSGLERVVDRLQEGWLYIKI